MTPLRSLCFIPTLTKTLRHIVIYLVLPLYLSFDHFLSSDFLCHLKDWFFAILLSIQCMPLMINCFVYSYMTIIKTSNKNIPREERLWLQGCQFIAPWPQRPKLNIMTMVACDEGASSWCTVRGVLRRGDRARYSCQGHGLTGTSSIHDGCWTTQSCPGIHCCCLFMTVMTVYMAAFHDTPIFQLLHCFYPLVHHVCSAHGMV